MEPTKKSMPVLVTLVFAIIGALWAVDLLLARVDIKETRIQARHYFDAGAHLLEANRAADALDPLSKAHAMDRADTRYALEFASALIQAGKLEEAQGLLTDILERTPNDGEANLLEARLVVRRGTPDDAAAYYHRAIYGTWNENGARRSIETRLELANQLAANHSDKELLPELLSLDAEAPGSVEVRKQMAPLFLAAGAPARAEAAYRGLIHDDPGEKANYRGLGEAELALGNYRAAEIAFQNAGDEARAGLASEMTSLDPTPRRLSSAEKFRRSVQILELARDSLSRCQGDAEAPQLLDAAAKELAAKVRGNVTNELAEERLSLAEQLWAHRQANCGSANSTDEALARLMQKLRAS